MGKLNAGWVGYGEALGRSSLRTKITEVLKLSILRPRKDMRDDLGEIPGQPASGL